jgi:hypothetical protein
MTRPRNRSFPDYGSGIAAGKDGTVPETLGSFEPSVPGNVATIFATQLDGTKQNGLVRRRGYGCVLGPKILIEWHAIELGGMAGADRRSAAGAA